MVLSHLKKFCGPRKSGNPMICKSSSINYRKSIRNDNNEKDCVCMCVVSFFRRGM